MHQQEVGGVLLLAHHLGDPGGHGNGGNAGGADKRVDLLLREHVHQLSQQHAASGAKTEGDNAHGKDQQGAGVQEVLGGGGGANGDAKEDGDDVHQLVLDGLIEALHNAALLHKVAKHQAAHQRGGRRQHEGHEDGDHDGEQYLLGLRDRAQLLHLDPALLLGGQSLHDGRLDHRHQGHIAVRSHGDGPEKVRGKLCGGVDGRGAVRAADDADRGGLRAGEDGKPGRNVCDEDTQLGSGAQEQGLRVGDKGGEIGARAHADEDKAGIDAQLHAQVQVVEQPAVAGAKLRPVYLAVGKDLRMVHPGARQVRQQHTEGDGQEQKRLELFNYSQVQQHTGDGYHHQIQRLAYNLCEACALQEILYCFHRLHSLLNFGMPYGAQAMVHRTSPL